MSRITSTMLSRNYLHSVSKNMANVQTLQNQLSTGKQISKPSDDPYKASRIIRMYADIGANEQYNDNITDATNFLDVTDTSLTQMTNLLSRVRELLVSAGNAAYGSEQLKSIQDEMNEKVNQLAQIMNTNFDGKYVFGGTKVDSKPVTVVDGKLQYADSSGNAIVSSVYKDADGKYTTSSTGKYNTVNLTDTIDLGNSQSTTVGKILEEELNDLNKIDSDKLTEEQKLRKTELNSIINPGAGSKVPQVYKNPSGNYTTKSEGENLAVNLKDVNKADIDAQIEDTPETETDKLSELNKIKESVIYYNQLSSDMKMEISQGVIVNYNQKVTDILEFTDKETGKIINVSDLFSEIIDNLNSESGKSDLIGSNLSDLDKVISNVLSKSSAVGALQNRMEAAKTQNESDNDNLTAILSNVEDIDFTEKMIDFATLMTVYKASLQISANILPKTIMDYL